MEIFFRHFYDKYFIMLIFEVLNSRKSSDIESPPGSLPILPGYVRLYHQTTEQNLKNIERNGLKLEFAKGIEGPRAIYASERGFYGTPDSRPTLEFQVPKDMWDDPFVLCDVTPDMFVAVHYPWHKHVRYLLSHPDTLSNALNGEFDNLTGDYKPAVEYVKHTRGK